MKNRKELKFICDDKTLVQVENRIKTVMAPDPNQKGDSYNIRSVYYDSPNNTCFYENQAGVGTRHKYRLRIYDTSDAVIKAEIKSKYYDTTHKESAGISREQFEAMMSGDTGMVLQSVHRDGRDPAPALLRFCERISAGGYRPVSIVEYERSAYIYEPCNVRVTFDRNIAASNDFDCFFDIKLGSVPLCEVGRHVLEVKYDEFLPDYLLQLLRVGDMRRTSFSKYYESRLTLGL